MKDFIISYGKAKSVKFFKISEGVTTASGVDFTPTLMDRAPQRGLRIGPPRGARGPQAPRWSADLSVRDVGFDETHRRYLCHSSAVHRHSIEFTSTHRYRTAIVKCVYVTHRVAGFFFQAWSHHSPAAASTLGSERSLGRIYGGGAQGAGPPGGRGIGMRAVGRGGCPTTTPAAPGTPMVRNEHEAVQPGFF